MTLYRCHYRSLAPSKSPEKPVRHGLVREERREGGRAGKSESGGSKLDVVFAAELDWRGFARFQNRLEFPAISLGVEQGWGLEA